MRLTTLNQVDQFLSVVDSCKGNIYLTSKYGDRYNLKSKLSQFLAINAILDDHSDQFELLYTDKADTEKLRPYILTH